MQQIAVEPRLWSDIVTIADRKHQRPDAIIRQALREYLQRAADEELLIRSERAARRAPYRASQAEEIVRRHRQTPRRIPRGV